MNTKIIESFNLDLVWQILNLSAALRICGGSERFKRKSDDIGSLEIEVILVLLFTESGEGSKVEYCL